MRQANVLLTLLLLANKLPYFIQKVQKTQKQFHGHLDGHEVKLITPRWTIPQMSIIIIYNITWSILIQWIRIKLSGDNLT